MRKYPWWDDQSNLWSKVWEVTQATKQAVEEVTWWYIVVWINQEWRNKWSEKIVGNIDYQALEDDLQQKNPEEYKFWIPLNEFLDQIFPKEKQYGAEIRIDADTSYYILEKTIMDMVWEEDNTYTLKDTSNKNIKDLIWDSYWFKVNDGHLRISSRTAKFKPKTVGLISNITLND